MPSIMFSHNRDPLVIAGFSLFVVSLVFQTIFWTLQVFTCPHASDSPEELECPPAHVPEKPIPPHDFTPTNVSSINVKDEKYSAFVHHMLHHTPNIHNSTVLYVTETPHTTEPAAEIDPFDTWDTSDVGATQRAACTLAPIEYEKNMDAAIGLGIFTPVDNAAVGDDVGEGEVEIHEIKEGHDVQIHAPVLERQNSPPIPDYDMTPRSTNFPVGIFQEHAPSVGRKPTLVISPIGESREFDEGSGRLVPTRGPCGDLGTGEWLVKSQTIT